jgi:glycosyltransferase involved in cell wall biosynthesis
VARPGELSAKSSRAPAARARQSEVSVPRGSRPAIPAALVGWADGASADRLPATMNGPPSQKTVLVVSRFFPPMFDVGGKRAWRFAKYLPEHGWRAVVITDQAPIDRPLDGSIEIPPDLEIIREYYPSWWSRPRNAGSDGTIAAPIESPRRKASGILRRISRQLRVPVGDDVVLAPRFARLARSVARRSGARAIFATSAPYSALVFGAAASRSTGLPLCLDLRDPWSLNFFQQDKPAWVRHAEALTERRLLEAADRVTFTSESTASAYRSRYPTIPSDKIVCITNSFDPAQKPDPAPRTDDTLKIVHFGNVYGRRTLAPVLLGLEALRRRGVPGADRIRIVNLGRITRDDLELSERLGVAGQLSSQPFVPYQEGLEALASADVQLLLGYADETLFLPAKLFDYLMTGAPILCIAPESELTRIVRDTGAGAACDPADVEAIASALEHALSPLGLRQGRPLDALAVRRYSARQTAGQLAELLDEMVASRRD